MSMRRTCKNDFCIRQLILLLILVFTVTGCDVVSELWGPKKPIIESHLPWEGQVFSLMADDAHQNGLYDLIAIDHGGGELKEFIQKGNSRFEAQESKKIGFHPGIMTKWPKNQAIKIFAAEGDGAIKALDANFKELSSREEGAPRYVSTFEWPSWGISLAVSPYINGYLVLLKNYDPSTGQSDERMIVPFSENPNTLRGSEKVSVGDLNGDGVNELIVVFSATGEVFEIAYPGNESTAKPKTRLLIKDPAFGMPNEVQIVDLDEDGDNDLLLPDETSPGKINILVNDGTGQFSVGGSLDFPGNQGIYEVRVSKDKDGLSYILAAGRGCIAIYQKPNTWRPGDQMPSQVIAWEDNLSFDMILKDLDGDGWLDGVVGLYRGSSNIWAVYGPLWENFKSLSERHFVLDSK